MCCPVQAPNWRTQTAGTLLAIVLIEGVSSTDHADTSDTEEISNERIGHADSSETHQGQRQRRQRCGECANRQSSLFKTQSATMLSFRGSNKYLLDFQFAT